MRRPPGDLAQDAFEPEPFPAEGWPHDRILLTAGTVRDMFLVEVGATLASKHRLTDDEISDLIEAVVDDLDRLSVEPSVGTRRIDDNVEFTVGVTIDEGEEFEALTLGLGVIKGAFDAAGIGTAKLVEPRDLRSRVMPLQPA